MIKRHHSIAYSDGRAERLEKSGLELLCFHQIGGGILPYEYWLDSNHRLIAVITGNRAYLLDEGAENAFEENVMSLREGGTYVC